MMSLALSPPVLPLRRRQMNDVIESCKYHQHDDDREPYAEAYFLRPLRERSTANGFDCIEQKVTAIEQWDRKQVQKPDRNRQHSRQMHQRGKANRRDLPGNLGNSDGAAELVGRLA